MSPRPSPPLAPLLTLNPFPILRFFSLISGLATPTLLTIALPSVLTLTDTYLASYADSLTSDNELTTSNLMAVSATGEHWTRTEG